MSSSWLLRPGRFSRSLRLTVALALVACSGAHQKQPPSAAASGSGAAPVRDVPDAALPVHKPAPSAGGTNTAMDAGQPPMPDSGMRAAEADAGDALPPASATDPCASLRAAAAAPLQLTVGAAKREYLLHVPNAGPAPLPLVLDVHGLLTHAAFQRAESGFAAAADSAGFAVAWPQALDGAWNLGADACCSADPSVDDIGFMRALVSELVHSGCIDPKRVYAAGSGVGGGLAQQLGCRAADVFAGVLSRDFDLLQQAAADCTPMRPVAVMATRDMADPRMPYAGGEQRPANGLPVRIRSLGAVASFARWARVDGCAQDPRPASAGCQAYTSCGGGVEVQLCDATHATALDGWAFLRRFQLH